VTSLEALLSERLAAGFAAAGAEGAGPAVRRSQRADFQADGALAAAKRLGRNPRELAAEVVERSELDDLCETVEIAGPGFVNLTVRSDVLSRLATEMATDDRLGVPLTSQPDRVVIDYSAPNAAKEMHVGHLRSTIIGDAAVRLLEWCGHTVVRQNHIGEWGTPFGMLIEHLLDIGETEAAHELSVGDLGTFYKAARRKFDLSPEFADRSRSRVVLLQGGDKQTMRLWTILVEQSKAYFLAVYDQLGVLLTDDDFAGESAYNSELDDVIAELTELGLVQVSDGAECVFPAGFKNRDGDPLPLIVRKSDGGFGYDVTDLAAIRHRLRDLKGTRLLYVVGLPQQVHFQMVFRSARDAGWVGGHDAGRARRPRVDPGRGRQDPAQPRGGVGQANRPAHRGRHQGRAAGGREEPRPARGRGRCRRPGRGYRGGEVRGPVDRPREGLRLQLAADARLRG